MKKFVYLLISATLFWAGGALTGTYTGAVGFADYMFKVLDESVPFVGIPEAQHHLFLDQPIAFVSALRTLLAEWRHSRPDREG